MLHQSRLGPDYTHRGPYPDLSASAFKERASRRRHIRWDCTAPHLMASGRAIGIMVCGPEAISGACFRASSEGWLFANTRTNVFTHPTTALQPGLSPSPAAAAGSPSPSPAAAARHVQLLSCRAGQLSQLSAAAVPGHVTPLPHYRAHQPGSGAEEPLFPGSVDTAARCSSAGAPPVTGRPQTLTKRWPTYQPMQCHF